MATRPSSVDWDRDVYARGLQLNLWPDSRVVSAFFLHKALWKGPNRPKVLEVGCGAGNNLWALAEMGYKVFGIEQSETAVRFAKQRLASLGFKSEVSVGTMTDLPFEDESFDFILDRGGITQVALNEVPKVSNEIYRVLRKGGMFSAFTLFGEDHPARSLGKLLENGSYDDFEAGYFTTVGLTSFFSEENLRKFFSQFDNLLVTRTVESEDGILSSDEYALKGRK